mmetsp:Transcript_22483/g.36414  ORF Transcript_22483/g.36414 Transcript_22483/m.36414 type:complete len:162 (+) Transcript_22483:3093-3578(+)
MPRIALDTSWQCLVALKCGFAERENLDAWADAQRTNYSETAHAFQFLEICDALRRNPFDAERVTDCIERLVSEEFTDFQISGTQAEQFARTMWENRLSTYLNGNQPPVYICLCVTPLEMLFDFPDWLGQMFDACDWVQDVHTRSDCPMVAAESKRLLGVEN